MGGSNHFYRFISLPALALFFLFCPPGFAEKSIRSMVPLDMAQVLELDKKTSSDPWTRNKFLDEIEGERLIRVIEIDGKIVGYCVFEIGVHNLKIKRMAVLPEERNKGYGAKFLEDLTSRVKPTTHSEIIVEIGEAEKDSVGYFEKSGFVVKRQLIRRADGELEIKHTARFPLWNYSDPAARAKFRDLDFYARLNVPPTATPEEIEAAFRRQMKRAAAYPEAVELLAEARALKDPQRRARYDEKPPTRREIPDSHIASYPVRRRLNVTAAAPLSQNYYQRLGAPENFQGEFTDFYIEAGRKFADDKVALERLAEAYRVLNDEVAKAAFDRQEARRKDPAWEEGFKKVKQAPPSNPFLPSLYARAGVTPQTPPDLITAHIDEGLIRNAGDPDAQAALLESLDTLVVNWDKRNKYDAELHRVATLERELTSTTADENASIYLRRMMKNMRALTVMTAQAEQFFSALEWKVVDAFGKRKDPAVIKDVIQQLEVVRNNHVGQSNIFDHLLRSLRARIAEAVFQGASSPEEQKDYFEAYGFLSKTDPVRVIFEETRLKERVETPSAPETEPQKWRRLIDETFYDSRGRRPGLLESSLRRGRLSLMKVTSAASMAAWSGGLLFPESVGRYLYDLGASSSLGVAAQVASAGAAAFYTIYAAGELPTILQRAYYRGQYLLSISPLAKRNCEKVYSEAGD